MMASSNVYRDGYVHVMADRCATCVFRPGNLMSLQRGRLGGMVAETMQRSGGHIICHGTLECAGATDQAVCRGWWDRYGADDTTFRLARILGVVRFEQLTIVASSDTVEAWRPPTTDGDAP
jgi:hypothetical protein